MKRIFIAGALLLIVVSAAQAQISSRHTIVYNSSAEQEEGLDIAQYLQAAVKAATGFDLRIADDSQRVKGKTITIGRGKPTEDTFDYGIAVKGNSIAITGGGCWALTKAVRLLQEGLTQGKNLKDIQCQGNIYSEYLFPRQEGTNLRILDDNIWQYDDEKNVPDVWKAVGKDCRNSVRYRALAELTLAYRPDILTLQEYSSAMDKYLAPELEKYGYVNCTQGEDSHWNFTPIFYNKATVKPEESKYVLYTPKDFSNVGTKSLTAAAFTLNENGKRFCIINTHLWYKEERTTPGSDMARASQLRLCMAIGEQLLAKYKNDDGSDLPLFMMGDLNSTLHSTGIQQMLDAGYKPVQDVATVYGDRRCGHHVCSAKEGFSRKTYRKGTSEDFFGAIDHFLVYSHHTDGKIYGGAEVKVFHRIYSYFTIEFTDHYPNYADIRL